MNITRLAAQDTGVVILFSILAVIFTLGLIALLVWSIYREQKRWDERQTDQDPQDKEIIDTKIESYITQRKEFTLYCAEVIEYDEMVQTLGEFQYESALSLLIKRLKQVFASSAKISTEGDRILVFSESRTSKADIEKICGRILYEAGIPVVLGGTLNVYFDIAVGVASFPHSGKSKQEILDNAHVALLNSKRMGYNRFVIYDDQLGSYQTQEYKNYLEVKEAIKNNEFTLYYQPIVSLDNQEVYAVETLLRWNHKTRGVLSPQVFLNILEQSGDINWVGLWSFEQLIKQKEAWQKSYPENDFLVSINISQKQIRNKDIIEELRRIIKKYHVPYSQVILEIIEPAALSSEELVINNINRLSQLGFKIAIDNYGADFVSPQKLENLSINMLKLEKKFFTSAMEQSGVSKGILELLISFCRQKGISLICMGIETEQEIAFAQENSIRYAQGFHFAKPKNAKETMQEIILTPWKS